MNWQPLEDAWRSSWRPPERYSPTEWADAHRFLPASVSAEPGRYRSSRTPYVRGVQDAVAEPGVEEVWFVAGTQISKTTSQENVLGYWICNDPGPCLIVKPNEASVEESVKERWRPLLDGTPALKRHLSPQPHDNTLKGIKLDTMPIYFGWAGSPQSLASRPCRYVLLDECDKFPPFAGREADPVSLARERTATYLHRRRLVAVSTPTTREGTIWKGWESCGDKRHFYVPCPHCGAYQILAWPQVKWPKLDVGDKVKMADAIERDRLAWYECGHPGCKGRIEESHKPKMLDRGVWLSHDSEDRPVQTIDRDGTVHGERPVTKRVGFQLSSLYSPWRKFWELAAEFIRAAGDLAATMNFRNSKLAEPFEVQVSKREPSAIREKVELAKTLGQAGKRFVVPPWAVLIHATADVQQGYVYWQIDAWGYELQSKRLDYGVCHGGGTDDNAIRAALQATYQRVFYPPTPIVTSDGVPVPVPVLVVDAKYKTAVVTQFALLDPRRVQVSEGDSKYTGVIAQQKVRGGVIVWQINTMQSKDTLDRLIGDPDPLKWQVTDDTDDEFCTQLASEHKVIDPKTKLLVWQKKTSGAQNHFWDTSANSCAVAVASGVTVNRPAPRTTEETPNNISSSAWMGGGKRW